MSSKNKRRKRLRRMSKEKQSAPKSNMRLRAWQRCDYCTDYARYKIFFFGTEIRLVCKIHRIYVMTIHQLDNDADVKITCALVD